MANLIIIILGMIINFLIYVVLRYFFKISSLKIFFYLNFILIPLILSFILFKKDNNLEILFYIFFYFFILNYIFIGLTLLPQSSIRYRIIELIIKNKNKIKILQFKKIYNDHIIYKLRKTRLTRSEIITKKKPFIIKKKVSIFLLIIFYYFKKLNNQDNYF
jgi:hypothetical protein